MRVLIYEDMVSHKTEVIGCIEQRDYESVKNTLDEYCGSLGSADDKWSWPWYEYRIEDVHFVKPETIREDLKKRLGK